MLSGGDGKDLLNGEGGDDTADYSRSGDRIAVSLTTGAGLGGDAHGDVLIDVENLIGTNSSVGDVLTGSTSGNRLVGLAGDDWLRGLGGDDRLVGGAGADSLDGGDGFDTADYSTSLDRIAVNLSAGTALGGDAHLDLLTGIENLTGTNSQFKDWLTGDAQDNRLEGLAGDDELSGMSGDDVLVGGAGADVLTGGEGNDTADYSQSSERIAVNLGAGTALGGHAHLDVLSGVENLIGTDSAFTDWLTGDDQANRLAGLAGDDELKGMGGDDLLEGGTGSDLLVGGDGDDVLVGGEGVDTIYGDAGDDTVVLAHERSAYTVTVLGGTTVIEGPDGTDYVRGVEWLRFADMTTDADGSPPVDGTTGSDTLAGTGATDVINGLTGDDLLYGLADDDALFGGDGNDWLAGGEGADRLVGGPGNDTADYSSSLSRVDVDLAAGTGRRGDAQGDALSGVENVIGSARSNGDRLAGDAGANWLNGLSGADELYGRDGDDVLIGGLDSDLIDGGEGFDIARFSENRSTYVITVMDGWVEVVGPDGRDRVYNVERLQFADMSTTASGDPILQIATASSVTEDSSTDGFLTEFDRFFCPDAETLQLKFGMPGLLPHDQPSPLTASSRPGHETTAGDALGAGCEASSQHFDRPDLEIGQLHRFLSLATWNDWGG